MCSNGALVAPPECCSAVHDNARAGTHRHPAGSDQTTQGRTTGATSANGTCTRQHIRLSVRVVLLLLAMGLLCLSMKLHHKPDCA